MPKVKLEGSLLLLLMMMMMMTTTTTTYPLSYTFGYQSYKFITII
jgi:hypothetical protein